MSTKEKTTNEKEGGGKKGFSSAICDLEQSVRLSSLIEDPMQEISSQRK